MCDRIRDKIAASKKKGMWMGGLPSLGYDVQNRKLIVNRLTPTHAAKKGTRCFHLPHHRSGQKPVKWTAHTGRQS
jgi:DNA invertase Pin-like site-specific DNA recombinase